LHRELAEKGVRVQAVLPGATATGFWDAAGVLLHHPSGTARPASDRYRSACVSAFISIAKFSRQDTVPWRRSARSRLVLLMVRFSSPKAVSIPASNSGRTASKIDKMARRECSAPLLFNCAIVEATARPARSFALARCHRTLSKKSLIVGFA